MLANDELAKMLEATAVYLNCSTVSLTELRRTPRRDAQSSG
jgi:hypothetical protein